MGTGLALLRGAGGVRLDRKGRPEPLGQPDQLARRGQQDQRALMAQMALTVSLT